MQNLLYALEEYVELKSLMVNVGKTKVIVLGRSIVNCSLKYKNFPLEFVDSVRYLGFPFARNGSYRSIGSEMHCLFTGGLARVQQIAHQHKLGDRLLTYIRLMQTFALSPGSYGAQIWAVVAMDFREGMVSKQERSYVQFLKKSLMYVLPRTIPRFCKNAGFLLLSCTFGG